MRHRILDTQGVWPQNRDDVLITHGIIIPAPEVERRRGGAEPRCGEPVRPEGQ